MYIELPSCVWLSGPLYSRPRYRPSLSQTHTTATASAANTASSTTPAREIGLYICPGAATPGARRPTAQRHLPVALSKRAIFLRQLRPAHQPSPSMPGSLSDLSQPGSVMV